MPGEISREELQEWASGNVVDPEATLMATATYASRYSTNWRRRGR